MTYLSIETAFKRSVLNRGDCSICVFDRTLFTCHRGQQRNLHVLHEPIKLAFALLLAIFAAFLLVGKLNNVQLFTSLFSISLFLFYCNIREPQFFLHTWKKFPLTGNM